MTYSILLIACLLGADPTAVITGDKVTFVGMPAKLTAASSSNVKKCLWMVSPEPFYSETMNGGMDCRIGHDETATFYVTLVTTSPEGDTDTATWTLRVEAKARTAQNATLPSAPPTPPPQVQSNVAKEVARQLAMMQPAEPEFDPVAWLDDVKSITLKDDARRMATCMLQMSRFLDGLPANSQPDVGNIVKGAATLCRGSLTNEQWAAWTPWFQQLGAGFDQLADNGDLETIGDYADTFSYVASELKDYANAP